MEVLMKKKTIPFIIFTLLFYCLLSGCGASPDGRPLTKTGFYFDTVISVTLYDSSKESLLEECFAIADRYERYFSNTIEDSDISKINASAGTPVEVHEETAELLLKGISYGELTDGRFDITVGKLSDLWNFSTKALIEETDASMIPTEEEIDSARSTVDYHCIQLEGTTVTLTNPEARIDPGGIAKGYIADRMKEFLNENGVTSGFINLGGNVLTLGAKEDGSPYRLGIQRPFSETGASIAVVSVTDETVVSSGVYERCFTVGDTLYHHILDVSTGYPYDNGLLGVTVITKYSADGDALSTSCFSLGLTDGMALIESLDGTEAVFITDDFELHTSSGIGTAIPFEEIL